MFINEWLLCMCLQDTTSHHKSLRAALTWGYAVMHEMLQSGPLFFDPSDLKLLRAASSAVFIASRELMLQATNACNGLWRLLPKAHQLMHLVEDALRTGLNPSYHWTFGDEDHVGKMARILLRLHRDTAPNKLVLRCIGRLKVNILR